MANYWNTENDEWAMSSKRPILWLCIYFCRDGLWKKCLDKNLAIKIAKMIYNDWTPPKKINDWGFDANKKVWTFEKRFTHWCIHCLRPALFGYKLIVCWVNCSKCKVETLLVGKCDNHKCKIPDCSFECKLCEIRSKECKYLNDPYGFDLFTKHF